MYSALVVVALVASALAQSTTLPDGTTVMQIGDGQVQAPVSEASSPPPAASTSAPAVPSTIVASPPPPPPATYTAPPSSAVVTSPVAPPAATSEAAPPPPPAPVETSSAAVVTSSVPVNVPVPYSSGPPVVPYNTTTIPAPPATYGTDTLTSVVVPVTSTSVVVAPVASTPAVATTPAPATTSPVTYTGDAATAGVSISLLGAFAAALVAFLL